MTDSNTTPPEVPDEWADALAEQTIAEGADDADLASSSVSSDGTTTTRGKFTT